MTGVPSDLRFAVRMLVKSPVFTLTALLCLALGIGANTAIFSVVNGVLLRPLPFASPDRLVLVTELGSDGEFYSSFAPAEYLDIRDMTVTLQDVAGLRGLNFNLSGTGTPERIRGESVTANFFSILGVEPSLGRSFLPEGDPSAAGARSVVLSYGSWQTRYGGDPSIIGRAVSLSGEPHTIVGVAPASFEYPELVEMWVRSYRDGVPEPGLDLGDDLAAVRTLGYFSVIGRLADDSNLEQAQAEMAVIARRLGEAVDAEEHEIPRLVLQPLSQALTGDVRPALILLLGAVGLVLLIACANVANLLLARSTAREREVAVRAALGAGRARLVRQLLTENVLLGVLGGAIGLLLAVWMVDGLVRLAPSDIPRASAIGVDSTVLIFALAISVLTGLLFGGLPALHASRPNLHESLKEGGRGASEGRERRRFREALVVFQVALSLALLCAAGLLIKSLVKLQSVDPGFRPENVLVMRMNLPASRYPEEAQQAAFLSEVAERVRALPGITDVGAAVTLPFSGSAITLNFEVEGRPASPGEDTDAEYQPVTPGFFKAMGIPQLRGRPFDERDGAEAPQVVVINDALARWKFPGEDPVGQRLSFGGEPMEIIGVVGDVHHFSFEAPPRPEVYVPYEQDPWPFMALFVRAESHPLGLASAVRRQVLAVDKDQPVFAVSTMDQVLLDSTQSRRFTVRLLGAFAVIAIVLAVVGIYGVMSYTVNRRLHEIGIRMALGAQRSEVLRLTVGWGLKMVLVGVAIGIAAAIVLTRFMSSLLFGISATDPGVFVGVSILLIAAAFVAAYVPARRASRTDPLMALRYE